MATTITVSKEFANAVYDQKPRSDTYEEFLRANLPAEWFGTNEAEA